MKLDTIALVDDERNEKKRGGEKKKEKTRAKKETTRTGVVGFLCTCRQYFYIEEAIVAFDKLWMMINGT